MDRLHASSAALRTPAEPPGHAPNDPPRPRSLRGNHCIGDVDINETFDSHLNRTNGQATGGRWTTLLDGYNRAAAGYHADSSGGYYGASGVYYESDGGDASAELRMFQQRALLRER